MKKVLCISLCAAMALCVSACGSGSGNSQTTSYYNLYEPSYQTTANSKRDNVSVEFLKASTYTASWDEDFILVTVKITNDTGERLNNLVKFQAYQNDIPLEEKNYGTLDCGFDSDYQKQYIDSGESAEITYCFTIKNKSDNVLVEVYNLRTDKYIGSCDYTLE